MTRQLRDYYVRFHREEYLADVAMKWRLASRHSLTPDFNVARFVEDVLQPSLNRRKGMLKIAFSETTDDNDDPAYVTPDPLTLHVDHEVWDLAKLGEPLARQIIAHEIGHVVLHGHYPRAAFSKDTQARLKFAVEQNSAEWQADTFAGYFLLPDYLVKRTRSPFELATLCSVPIELAQRRFAEVREEQIRRSQNRDICTTCGNIGCTC